MSTPAEIIKEAQDNTHTNENNYPAATDWIRALNAVSDHINNEIVKNVNEYYFWDTFLIDTELNQTEYNIKTWKVAWDWSDPKIDVYIKEVTKCFIKYESTADFYTPVTKKSPELLEKDFDEYAQTQSKSDPIFYVQDRSIFVYPQPDPALSEWIKLNAIYTPPKILLASAESWLPLQPDKHNIYALWIEWQIYKSQWKNKNTEAQVAKKVFEEEITKVLTYLKKRIRTATPKTMWDLSDYS